MVLGLTIWSACWIAHFSALVDDGLVCDGLDRISEHWSGSLGFTKIAADAMVPSLREPSVQMSREGSRRIGWFVHGLSCVIGSSSGSGKVFWVFKLNSKSFSSGTQMVLIIVHHQSGG